SCRNLRKCKPCGSAPSFHGPCTPDDKESITGDFLHLCPFRENTMSVRVEQLSKTYGTQQALKGITFEAKQGRILGFLGPNGAGKSTAMKIISGSLAA